MSRLYVARPSLLPSPSPGWPLSLLPSLWLGGALALGAAACAAPAGGFSRLSASDQGLFQRCSEPLAAQLCRGGGGDARAACLAARAETYAERRTDKTRRRWLESNGCPASVLDAPEAMAFAAPAPAARPAPAAQAVRTAQPAAQRAPTAQPAAVVRASAPRVVARVAAAVPAHRPPPDGPHDDGPDGDVEGGDGADVPRPVAVVDPAPGIDRPPPPPAAAAAATNAPAGKPLAAAAQRLRETIVAHQPEMMRCVDRQLKLLPSLRAEGTLVLEVDGTGRVVQAGLRGDQLAGSTLEDCLRTLAMRWRFPGDRRGYAVEAPLRVSGRTVRPAGP